MNEANNNTDGDRVTRTRASGRCRPLLWLFLLAGAILLAGCAQPAAGLRPSPSPPAAAATSSATVVPATQQAIAAPAATPTPPPSATPAVTVDPGPFPAAGEARCGILLPVVAPTAASGTAAIGTATALDAAQSLDAVPEAARPAVRRMLEAPGTVGLAAYEIGQTAGQISEGVFLNADTPMPLASVVKILHLAAYAEAVQTGELNPEMRVPLAELDRYYLRNSDLNAHPQAVEALAAEGRVFGEPPAVFLEDVPRMMIEYSSNAATDYLHQLLGQERIEQTALDLGLTSQTAPCPFLGQFLLMGAEGDEADVRTLVQDPERYSREVMSVTEAYTGDADLRDEIGGWRGRGRRPSLERQSLLSERLNARGSAGDYARLMGLIANNEIGPWEQSVRIRRYLEWPTHIPVNQETLAWLGYKGGSLPGILTVAYYAQPWDRARPVVVALFFHDLPLDIYRQWRRTLPQDELARWLLYERDAISTLNALLSSP